MIIHDCIFICTKPVEYLIKISSDGTSELVGVEIYGQTKGMKLLQRAKHAFRIWWILIKGAGDENDK